jgi:hypothetical protein
MAEDHPDAHPDQDGAGGLVAGRGRFQYAVDGLARSSLGDLCNLHGAAVAQSWNATLSVGLNQRASNAGHRWARRMRRITSPGRMPAV